MLRPDALILDAGWWHMNIIYEQRWRIRSMEPLQRIISINELKNPVEVGSKYWSDVEKYGGNVRCV